MRLGLPDSDQGDISYRSSIDSLISGSVFGFRDAGVHEAIDILFQGYMQ